MLDQILAHFPAHVHPLTVVSDPDGVLDDESVLAALVQRGFALVEEADPVYLRHRVEQARPVSSERPLIVVTAGPLNELPYDLWQQGQRVTLALHAFFSNLAYPIVRTLSPAQRWRLSQAVLPSERLGRQATIDFLLRHVFDLDITTVQRPAQVLAWLNQYHLQRSAMPQLLADHALAQLAAQPQYAAWDLPTLLAERDAFARFVRQQWQVFIGQKTGQPLATDVVRPVLPFAEDTALQDVVAALTRSGALQPLTVRDAAALPAWSRPAVITEGDDAAAKRADELLAALSEQLRSPLAEARWERWQEVARLWAELSTLRHDQDKTLARGQRERCGQLEKPLDEAFAAWLRDRYAPLGATRLPVPHHVYHVPDYMAYSRRQQQAGRVALLILDGMSLADWHLIGSAWRARHPEWRFQEQLLLAQAPTITCVSRQALVSGLRPADFADAIHSNAGEAKAWSDFWARHDLPPEACAYTRLALRKEEALPLDASRFQTLCLLDASVDDIVHGASLGVADVHSSLRLWIEQVSPKLEAVVAELIALGFTLFLCSDHGHVEARGMGEPSEGILVQTRSKRARLYGDQRLAQVANQAFSDTILWGNDGLLPSGLWALMPKGRTAFARFGETVVTHGGLTLEEVVVPLITIRG